MIKRRRSPANTAVKEETLQPLIAIAALVLYGSHPAFEHNLDGSYVVRTLNGHSLPTELRLPAMAGDFRLFRLEQGVLTLRPNGKFTLHFRYYHQLVRRGHQPVSTPVMSDSETGMYTVAGAHILLTPRKKTTDRSRSPFSGTIAGEEIRAAYLLQSGGTSERVTLVLRRDPSFW